MAEVRRPKALRAGDQIRIVSPASPLTADQIREGVWWLEQQGYRVTFGNHVFDSTGYLAGSDIDRAADFTAAFLDPDVAAVACARGGYGSVRILDYVDLDTIASTGKLFWGFSDITTLHIALNRRGLSTLHAPMPITLGTPRAPWVYESLAANLRGDIVVTPPEVKGTTLNGGTVEGVVTGGCLCLLGDSIGTLEPLDTDDRILLIEDVDENPHRVDALLTHLRRAGLLDRAAGIVIGEMTRTDELADPSRGIPPWREIVAERLHGLMMPIILDFPFGHAQEMLSLPLGIRARLDADAGILTYLEPLCEADPSSSPPSA
ncbi:MAG: LD-carboxypeptidase [Fimbriimonadaceae bacterium]|nr:LD-carboxypeptidase [Fimbriimonadaceae bacterium]